jgi:hypothetical protein
MSEHLTRDEIEQLGWEIEPVYEVRKDGRARAVAPSLSGKPHRRLGVR